MLTCLQKINVTTCNPNIPINLYSKNPMKVAAIITQSSILLPKPILVTWHQIVARIKKKCQDKKMTTHYFIPLKYTEIFTDFWIKRNKWTGHGSRQCRVHHATAVCK